MEPARFRYMPDHVGGGGGLEEEEDDDEGSNGGCFLDVYVHGARGIHNICIYADQYVYAWFSLTSSPGHAPALSTRVAAAGGASPRFDERLPPLRVRRALIGTDALKCEVWMRSCAKSVLEDQLLGFALVPLAAVAAAEGTRLAQREFSLSSTDLFHSPAGTVRLSLALRSGGADVCSAAPPQRASISSEVVILEPQTPVECYSRVEFPDLNVARENEDMTVQCLPSCTSARRRHRRGPWQWARARAARLRSPCPRTGARTPRRPPRPPTTWRSTSPLRSRQKSRGPAPPRRRRRLPTKGRPRQRRWPTCSNPPWATSTWRRSRVRCSGRSWRCT